MSIKIKYLSRLTKDQIFTMTLERQAVEVEWHNGAPYKVEWL